jgi:hypothetical protein
MFKGIDKKRHTRTPYEIHTLEGMDKKRHPHAHSPGNLKELKCYEYFYKILLFFSKASL